MLITIVHTTSYGKLVLHKYPYEKIQLEQEGLEKLPPNELLEVILDIFDYCKSILIQSRSIIRRA